MSWNWWMPHHHHHECNPDNPDGIIELGVYVHCLGCRNAIIKCLRGFEGVEEIEIDAENHKVIVKGAMADPLKVADRVRRKIGKNVELISPKPMTEGQFVEPGPEALLFEVFLKISIHCEGCAKEVKNCILNMEGVRTVDVNVENHLVRVRGTMNPEELVGFILRRSGRHAQIIEQTLIPTRENNYFYHNLYHHSTPPPPPPPYQVAYPHQIFSDDNPNACSLM